MKIIQTICRQLTKQNINILTVNCHEAYQTAQCETGYNFYAPKYEGYKIWREEFRKKPNNYYELNYFPPELDFDIVLSHQKFGGFQYLYPISKQYKLPLISLEHTCRMKHFNDNTIKELKKMSGEINTFISDWSVENWGYSHNDPTVRVIKHGIATDTFKPNKLIPFSERRNNILVVANDAKNRDFCLGTEQFLRVTKDLERSIIGYCPGFSEPAKNLEDLVSKYQTHKIYVNNTTLSPIPTSVLEAMSSGMAVITTNTCAIPEFITDGYNGIFCNTDDEFKTAIKLLMNDTAMAEELGKRARETIVEKFNIDEFVNNWKKVIGELV